MKAIISLLVLVCFCFPRLLNAEPVHSYASLQFIDAHEDHQQVLFYNYFLEPQTNFATYDESGYLDADTQFLLELSQQEGHKTYSIAGDYQFERFLTGISYRDSSEGRGEVDYKLGYLLADNLLVATQLVEDSGAHLAEVYLEYEHTISDLSYIGFNIKTDSDLSDIVVSSQLFMPIFAQQFIRVGVNTGRFKGIKENTVRFDYYFTPRTNLSLGSIQHKKYIEIKHFINFNMAARFQIAENEIGKVYTLGLFTQF